MGVKDDIITSFFEDPNVFCDFMNGAVFGGKQILRPEHLEQLPRELIMQLPWEGEGRQDQRTYPLVRDTVKQAYFNTMYAVFICENQSEIHYGMPVRMLLYDSVQYGDQLKKKRKDNKKAKNLKSSAEFLSGIHKGEQLTPVVSVVFYYGDSPWDGPLSLEEMICLPDDAAELKEYLPRYKVHLVDPKNTDPGKFPGDWRLILETLSCGNHKKDLIQYIKNHERELEGLSAKASRALLTMLGNDMKRKYYKEEITVCRALEELKEEGKSEGKIEGKREEEVNIIRKMLRKRLTVITICHWLDVEEEFVKTVAELQDKYPDYSSSQILNAYESENKH